MSFEHNVLSSTKIDKHTFAHTVGTSPPSQLHAPFTKLNNARRKFTKSLKLFFNSWQREGPKMCSTTPARPRRNTRPYSHHILYLPLQLSNQKK
jgi:hypothetical protein